MEGHNYSQGDLESDGEDDASNDNKNPASTGQGCYKNYDHFQNNRKATLKPSQVSFYLSKIFLFFIMIVLPRQQ